MKPSELAKRADEHLAALKTGLPTALRNVESWMGIGYGSGGSGGGRSKGDHSDPTFAAADGALARIATGQARDFAARDHAIITEGLVTAELALKRVRDAVARNQALPVGVVQAAEGCEPCSRVSVGGSPHESSWQAVYRRYERPDNPAGPKMPLCSFHSEFLDRYGVLPAPAINEYHLGHLGSRIPYQLIRDWHPDEFSLAQSKARGKLLGRNNLGLREATG